MNSKRIFSLAGPTLLAGGLLAGSIGWAAAQEDPIDGTPVAGTPAHGSGHANQQDHNDPEHARMHAAVAGALGLTVEKFQAELEAGKTVPQIAEEQGVDLADLHETITSQLHTNGG